MRLRRLLFSMSILAVSVAALWLPSAVRPTSVARADDEGLFNTYLPLVRQAATCLQQDNAGFENEPNNTLSEAQNWLPLCLSVPLRGRLDASDTPYDLFRLVVSTPTTIHLTLVTIPAGSDFDLYLYNAAGSPVASSRNALSQSEFISYPTAPGTFYVLVFRTYGPSDDPYSLYWLP